MEERDQDKVRELLQSEAWKIILKMIRAIKKGYEKRCMNPSSPVPVMMDAKSRYNELEQLMFRIGEVAGIQGYDPFGD